MDYDHGNYDIYDLMFLIHQGNCRKQRAQRTKVDIIKLTEIL